MPEPSPQTYGLWLPEPPALSSLALLERYRMALEAIVMSTEDSYDSHAMLARNIAQTAIR
jgi:hypothetical protein